MGSIPTLSYTIRHSLNRLQRQHLYYEQEILTSRKLMFGMPGIATPFYGIVSGTDPTSHVSSSSEPLVVSENSQNTLTVDVNPGYGVFLSGVWMQLHATQLQLALADTTPGVPNVVFLQYILDTAPSALNDALQPVSPYTFRIGGTIDTSTLSESVLLGTATVTDYLSLPAAVREDYIPLAIVTVQTLSGGVTTNLAIDHTQASYSWNRPWFSPVDIYHRSQVGTGTVTATNPHGESGNDLTYNEFTALQVHTEHGMILADDKSIAKVPGYRCEERTSTFLGPDDALGTVTGYPGALWVELTHYPVVVGACWFDAGGVVLAGVHVPGTNLVAFPYDAPAAEIHVTYTRVEACEPPVPNTTTFLTSGPAEEELIIAGGLGLGALANVEETMGDAWQFPQRYDFFVDGDGTLLKTPQVIYCWKQITAISGLDPTTITPYGPGIVQVGLMGAGGAFTLDLKIYGTDVNGASIDQTFNFTNATWMEPGPVPNPNLTYLASRWSSSTYATVTNVEVVSAVGVNPNAGVMLWMLQTPYSNYDKMKDACHVAATMWNGYYFSSVTDKRVICTTSRPEVTSVDSAQTEMLIRLLAGGATTVYHEDLRRPRYHHLGVGITAAATGYVSPTNALSKWQPGIHGGYVSAALPVNPASGAVWTISQFGTPHRDTTFMNDVPVLAAYDPGAAMWQFVPLAAVPGLPGTYRGTTPGAFTPSRISVWLLSSQVQSYAVYG